MSAAPREIAHARHVNAFDISVVLSVGEHHPTVVGMVAGHVAGIMSEAPPARERERSLLTPHPKTEDAMPASKPIPSGITFGQWTILQAAPSRNGYTRSLCLCRCGTVRSVPNHSLRQGESRGCGCQKKPIARGTRYGRLTIIEEVTLVRGQPRRARCRCDCGVVSVIRMADLRRGKTRSCGCLIGQVGRERMKTHGATFGRNQTPEYKSWGGMKQRCLNPGNPNYPHYGGRGITICERWRESFEAFLADIGLRPSPQHSIDRIDNNGPYAPDNCRWATRLQQARNQRRRSTAHTIQVDGVDYTVTELAHHLSLSRATVVRCLEMGVPLVTGESSQGQSREIDHGPPRSS